MTLEEKIGILKVRLASISVAADGTEVNVFNDKDLREFILSAENEGHPNDGLSMSHAFVSALMSQLLREAGREYSIIDGGQVFKRGPVCDRILQLIDLELKRISMMPKDKSVNVHGTCSLTTSYAPFVTRIDYSDYGVQGTGTTTGVGV